MSVAFALPAAFTYGTADFLGGLAARRSPVIAATFVVQVAGFSLLLPAVWVFGGVPSVAAIGLGVLASFAGTTGLLLYLRGLAVGPMGVIAPLSAVVGAGLPLVVGMIGGERLGPVTLLAIGIALLAILLATAGTERAAGSRTGVLLGLGAGVGFGLFFVGLDATPADSGLWPLLAGRISSTVLLGAVLLARPSLRAGWGGGLWLMIASGISDTTANVLFLLATRAGDLGVTSVVVSLYPVVVVVLARLVLKERLTGLQFTATGLALGASVLLATAS